MTEEKKEPTELERALARVKELEEQVKEGEEEKRKAQAKKKKIDMSDLPTEKRGGQAPRKPFVIVTTNAPGPVRGRG